MRFHDVCPSKLLPLQGQRVMREFYSVGIIFNSDLAYLITKMPKIKRQLLLFFITCTKEEKKYAVCAYRVKAGGGEKKKKKLEIDSPASRI